MMVLPVFPVSIREVLAESITNELTVHFDASNHPEEELGLWFWGDGAVPEGEAPGEWMVDDHKFEKKEGADFVSTQVPILDIEEPVELGYIIVSHDGEDQKIFGDADGSITIYDNEIDEVWIDKDNKVHYLEPTINPE